MAFMEMVETILSIKEEDEREEQRQRLN